MFENPSFKLFQDSLDAEMKCLTLVDFGASVKQAESFSDEQEEKLWALNLLGAHSPQVLLDTMIGRREFGSPSSKRTITKT